MYILLWCDKMGATLDYIPFLDNGSDQDSDSVKAHSIVKKRIDQELSKIDSKNLHPLVSKLFPLKKRTYPLSILDEKEELNKNKLSQRYTSINSDSKYTQQEKLKLLTGYTLMRSRCLDIVNRNLPIVQNEWIINNENWVQAEKLVEDEISTKRKRIEHASAERKKRCLDFKPVSDFLRNRWNEKIDELISVGVLLSQKQLEEAENNNDDDSQLQQTT